MQNVMVDLETLSTRTNAAILSIGAVLFDVEKQELGETFYCVVGIESNKERGFHIDPNTIKWWLGQSEEAKKVLLESRSLKTSLPINKALEKLTEWLFKHGQNYKVWGNGSDFDNVILGESYRICGIPQPWGVFNNRCYRTISALAKENGDPGRNQEGEHHNALDDAISQAKHLLAILK